MSTTTFKQTAFDAAVFCGIHEIVPDFSSLNIVSAHENRMVVDVHARYLLEQQPRLVRSVDMNRVSMLGGLLAHAAARIEKNGLSLVQMAQNHFNFQSHNTPPPDCLLQFGIELKSTTRVTDKEAVIVVHAHTPIRMVSVGCGHCGVVMRAAQTNQSAQANPPAAIVQAIGVNTSLAPLQQQQPIAIQPPPMASTIQAAALALRLTQSNQPPRRPRAPRQRRVASHPAAPISKFRFMLVNICTSNPERCDILKQKLREIGVGRYIDRPDWNPIYQKLPLQLGGGPRYAFYFNVYGEDDARKIRDASNPAHWSIRFNLTSLRSRKMFFSVPLAVREIVKVMLLAYKFIQTHKAHMDDLEKRLRDPSYLASALSRVPPSQGRPIPYEAVRDALDADGKRILEAVDLLYK